MPISLIIAIPLIAFTSLLLLGGRLPRRIVELVGVGGIVLSCLSVCVVGIQYGFHTSNYEYVRQILWTWVPFYASGFEGATIQMALYLDSLSMLMVSVVTFIGSLIAIFSVSFMEEDKDIARFFACMNLFVGSMLLLVLADNLLVLYMGWEGVGLCSYLLIGFWYENPATGRASMKAFITTRIGDVSLLIAIILIFLQLGNLTIQEVGVLAQDNWELGSAMATLVALCLLGGAVGKSAQVPLQTWLPDAMLGPTPVSALIHAATMVTAGVYLIARMGALFEIAPVAQGAVLVVGAATLLIAGLAATVQTDMKRVLAYSTVSQIGYMFLALGAGAYSAAMFHFLTHAFFKALLFLSAGAIGHVMHHEYSLLKMGGLRKQMPMVFGVFVIGSMCLAALPFVTSGFYSKELILGQTFSSPIAGFWPWVVGVFGAFLTGLYTVRMLSIAFLGKAKGRVTGPINWRMTFPLLVLAGFSVVIGFLETPEILGHVQVFGDFVRDSVVTSMAQTPDANVEWLLLMVASATSLCGMLTAYVLYGRLRLHERPPGVIGRFLFSGLGFDAIYQALLVKPFVWASKLLRRDAVQSVYSLVVSLNVWMHQLLSRTQTGQLRHVVIVMVVAAVVVSSWMVFT